MRLVPPVLPSRQRGHGSSPDFGASRHKSQLSTSQIAESLAGGELPLTVTGDSETGDPREFARDSNEGVGEAIFSQPASLQTKITNICIVYRCFRTYMIIIILL